MAPIMEKTISITEAESQIATLNNAKDWILCAIDEQVKEDREINLSEPPAYLEQQLRTELANIEEDIKAIQEGIGIARNSAVIQLTLNSGA